MIFSKNVFFFSIACRREKNLLEKSAKSIVGREILLPRRAELYSTEKAAKSAVRGGALKIPDVWEIKMTRAIKIDGLASLCDTDIQILRAISLHLGADDARWVDYNILAKSLDIERDTVRKSVNRMVRKKVLKIEDGKLSIQNAVMVN